jgi:hypothetical protein
VSAALERLLAVEEIRRRLHDYCRAMDRRDDELGRSIWHEDGTADYGAEVFQGLGRDFVDQVSQSHLRRTAHSHQLATIGIEVDGDSAASEAYATVRLVTETPEGVTEECFVGRYLDRWSCRDGIWAIDHRVWVLDFGEVDRPVRVPLQGAGSRDRFDPSYAVLEGDLSGKGI